MLIKVLNWLCVCACTARYIQHKNSYRTDAFHAYLSTDCFTIISADNVDFMHSYAHIGNSSTHATSMQADQLQPFLSVQLENHDSDFDMGTPGTKKNREESLACLLPMKK